MEAPWILINKLNKDYLTKGLTIIYCSYDIKFLLPRSWNSTSLVFVFVLRSMFSSRLGKDRQRVSPENPLFFTFITIFRKNTWFDDVNKGRPSCEKVSDTAEMWFTVATAVRKAIKIWRLFWLKTSSKSSFFLLKVGKLVFQSMILIFSCYLLVEMWTLKKVSWFRLKSQRSGKYIVYTRSQHNQIWNSWYGVRNYERLACYFTINISFSLVKMHLYDSVICWELQAFNIMTLYIVKFAMISDTKIYHRGGKNPSSANHWSRDRNRASWLADIDNLTKTLISWLNGGKFNNINLIITLK